MRAEPVPLSFESGTTGERPKITGGLGDVTSTDFSCASSDSGFSLYDYKRQKSFKVSKNSIYSLMHWLHEKPKSDFPKFSTLVAVFWQKNGTLGFFLRKFSKFVQKIREKNIHTKFHKSAKSFKRDKFSLNRNSSVRP